MYAAHECRVHFYTTPRESMLRKGEEGYSERNNMESLKKKIREEGSVIGTEIVKVDSFLNHQIDVAFFDEIGAEFRKRFDGVRISKILTVEASGIGIACAAARYFGFPPVVFAKKSAPSTMTDGFFDAIAKSFTKGTVSNLKVDRKYLKEGDKVLILDDFLATGEASIALANLAEQAGAEVAGIGAVIEKGYQGGAQRLREKGYKVESLAVISRITDGRVYFEE
ncbi:MAG: xanthine phosphoribosyltransferase [Lentihominibacter sp.]|jgi:xanthine phosphoribosyltransferase